MAPELAELAEERLQHWSQLRQLAGLEVSQAARGKVSGALEAEFEAKVVALRAEYEARIAEIKREYPKQIARQLALGLMKHGGGGSVVRVARHPARGRTCRQGRHGQRTGSRGRGPCRPASRRPRSTLPVAVPAPSAAEPAPAPGAVAAPDDEPLTLEAYIDSARCTTCNECTNLNKRMFAYNAAKQAYIKDATAGTFQQLVLAAERCPVSIIHPGTPLNPNEKDLEKWVKRAEKFN